MESFHVFLQEQYMNFSCSPCLSWLFAEAKSSNVLIQEMELLGVHEATIRWMGSFLTDRSQRVRVCQVYSHPVTPNGGIPQGTKLAPLLLAILVNNLCRDWRYRIKYVDDTSVFESIPRCCLATFHLSPQILTPTLPCVTCGLMRKNVKIWLSIF